MTSIAACVIIYDTENFIYLGDVMREYDTETLAKLQQAELSIFKDFAKVCNENNLTYFGLAGTGIGALRHGGFIPWDDDIDVGLLRADYEKVIEIFKRDYADKYTVVNGDKFSGYPLMTTRICINGSEFVEEALKNIKCPLGIFLDVYAFDSAAADEKLRRKQAFGAWFYSKLLILKHIPFPVLPFYGFKRKLAHCVTACAWAFLNVFCVSHKWLYKKCKNISCKYNGTDTGFYAYFCDTDRYANFFEKDDLFPVRSEKFEDIEMCFPNNLEKSLTVMFGEYMQLPPPEKRKNHFPYKLKFSE